MKKADEGHQNKFCSKMYLRKYNISSVISEHTAVFSST